MSVATTTADGRVHGAEKHPPGLYVLFATEMWERFAFYSMLAMFTLYLQDTTEGFSWTDARATTLYSNYLMFVYFSPLVGGWIADRKLGFRNSVLLGGVFLGLGNLLIAQGTVPMMYAGITSMIIGNGFFKPNVSAMVGALYPEGSHLKDRAYNIFYMGINIGAFVAPLVAEAVRQRYGFREAYFVAAAGMVISIAILWFFKRHVDHADHRKVVTPTSSVAATSVDAPPKSVSRQNDALAAVPESRRILALIVIFLIVIVFWMVFHQNGSTLTYWANDNTDWASSEVLPVIIRILTLGFVSGEDVSGVISNAINPFWIITLTFPLVWFWKWLDRRGKEPSTPAKMAIGMFLTALSFYILYFAAKAGGDAGKVSPWWLIGAYAVISLGELMLSPMGLSLVSKVAPVRLRGVMMGGWFAATAIGNKLTQIGVFWNVWKHSTFFAVLGSMALVMAVVLVLLLKPLKKSMPGV
ncbi:MAG TPA: peptide MFS transporter [Thermoanaerobaculia bacterium]